MSYPQKRKMSLNCCSCSCLCMQLFMYNITKGIPCGLNTEASTLPVFRVLLIFVLLGKIFPSHYAFQETHFFKKLSFPRIQLIDCCDVHSFSPMSCFTPSCFPCDAVVDTLSIIGINPFTPKRDQLRFSRSVSHQRYIIQYGEFGNRQFAQMKVD